MVMATDDRNEEQQDQPVQPEVDISDLDVSSDAPVEQPAEEAQAPSVGGGEPLASAPSVPPGSTGDEPEGALPGLDATPDPRQVQELEELQRLRQVNAQKEWESQTMRQAQAIERRAIEQGSDPQSARQIARQHLSHQKTLRDQEGKALDLVGFVEGRNNAAMHYAQKYKLIPKQAIEDIKSLIRTRSPQEMDIEAKRMAQIRSQNAEIQRLKQGRVAPQTFDNSQGSAEVTTNQDRLLEAYISGDRSDAAVKAARRLSLGS